MTASRTASERAAESTSPSEANREARSAGRRGADFGERLAQNGSLAASALPASRPALSARFAPALPASVGAAASSELNDEQAPRRSVPREWGSSS